MDIQTLVKNPFVIGGIVIVVVILLYLFYISLFLFTKKTSKNQEIYTIPYSYDDYMESTKCPVWTDQLNRDNGITIVTGNCDQLYDRGYPCNWINAHYNCQGCSSCNL